MVDETESRLGRWPVAPMAEPKDRQTVATMVLMMVDNLVSWRVDLMVVSMEFLTVELKV